MELSPAEVKSRLDAGERLHLIDVRLPEEHLIARIDGAILVPMDTVPAALSSLEAKADEAPLVVFCHHGTRSLNVVTWLRGQGLSECVSMSGGIERWSLLIDPAVPRY